MAFPVGVVDFVIWVVTICFLLYRYASRNRNYWKDQNLVHEEFSLILGQAKRLLTKPPCLCDQERYQKFGRVFGIYEGGKPTLVVADPELVKQILVKDFTAFPNKRMNGLIQDCAKVTCDHLKLAAEKEANIDIKQ
ncbi:putative cytochrome P450 9f2 isoform X2 [Haemaphysalis longicornis]